MTILNVKEDSTKQTATRTAENLIITGEATRVFTVEFSNSSNPILIPQQAVDAGGIPLIYEPHPFSPFLFVSGKFAKTFASQVLMQEVTVEYDFLEDPLAQPAEVNYSHVASNEPIEEDVNGDLIVNSADEKFDPFTTADVFDLVIRITRNEATYDREFAASIIGSVNNDVFLGYEQGRARINVYDATEARVANLFYFEVAYEFQIRWQFRGGIETNWERRILDEGYREFIGTDADGNPEYEEIKDDKGDKVTAAVKLDGNGRILPQGDDPVFLTFDVHNFFDFAGLNITG